MVMRGHSIGLFVPGDMTVKMVFCDEAALAQDIEGIVHGRAAHMIIAFLHVDVQSLRVEVVVSLVYLGQDRKSFGGLSKPVLFEEILEYLESFFIFGRCCFDKFHGSVLLIYSCNTGDPA